MIAELLRDACGIVGIGLLGYGAWLWWEPAGFMVPGAALLGLAVGGALLGRVRQRPDSDRKA